jgi:hypothetical protein
MSKTNSPQISQAEVLDIFTYSDGKLLWKISPAYKIKPGSEAGTLRKNGYRVVAYKGKDYRTHHLVYLMFNGEYPKQIDHVNTVRDDNRIENLRLATNSENQWNKGLNANNTTGYKNIKWVQRLHKYVVAIAVNAKSKHVGVYVTLQDAIEAAANARNKMHGTFARSV